MCEICFVRNVRKIWLKIYLRGGATATSIPITAHVVVVNNPIDFQTNFSGSGAQNKFQRNLACIKF